jgi:hypothetical protein
MMSNLISKPGITGNVSLRRKSRGVTHKNNARETYNRDLFEIVIKSVLMGDHESEAEMTSPFPSGRVTTKNAGQLGTPVSFDCWGFNLRYSKNVTLGNYNLLTTNGVFQFIIGTDSNYLTVPIEDIASGVDSSAAESVAVSPHVGQGDTDELLSLGTGDLPSKSRITGNPSSWVRTRKRKSRGVNHKHYARTSDKGQLYELMMHSEPMREYRSAAEMTAPSEISESNNTEFLSVRRFGASDPLTSSGMVERSILKTGNNGETLDQESRQSRGVNHKHYARTTDNRPLSQRMIQSGLAGDRKRPAEMTGPFPPGKSNKCDQQHRIVPGPYFIPVWKRRNYWRPVNPRLHSGYLVQGNLVISFV